MITMLKKTRYNSSKGFTMAELLISLVIMGMLLAAVATALNASIINYNENEKIFKHMNTARQALVRMTTQIRSGLVDPNNIANEQQCDVICSDVSHVRYHYDAVNDQLLLYDYATAQDYLLCDNVTALTFKKDNSTTSGDVESVRISITVSDGTMEQKLSAAAVVRKVLER